MTDKSKKTPEVHTELRPAPGADQDSQQPDGKTPKTGEGHAHSPVLDVLPEPLDDDEIDDLFNDMPV